MVFHGSRSIFLVFFNVTGRFFKVFHDSRLIFYGSRLVYIRGERRRCDV